MAWNMSAWVAGMNRVVRPAAIRGLKLVGAAGAAEIRARIAIQGPPRSRPGEHPHKDSGDLYDSIWWEVDQANLRVYIAANIAYAEYLEFGTAKMAPRPFLRGGVIGLAARTAPERIALAFAIPFTAIDTSRMGVAGGQS